MAKLLPSMPLTHSLIMARSMASEWLVRTKRGLQASVVSLSALLMVPIRSDGEVVALDALDPFADHGQVHGVRMVGAHEARVAGVGGELVGLADGADQIGWRSCCPRCP